MNTIWLAARAKPAQRASRPVRQAGAVARSAIEQTPACPDHGRAAMYTVASRCKDARPIRSPRLTLAFQVGAGLTPCLGGTFGGTSLWGVRLCRSTTPFPSDIRLSLSRQRYVCPGRSRKDRQKPRKPVFTGLFVFRRPRRSFGQPSRFGRHIVQLERALGELVNELPRDGRQRRLAVTACEQGRELPLELRGQRRRGRGLEPGASAGARAAPQNVTVTDGALRLASPWKTASMLFPSGSRTNAA